MFINQSYYQLMKHLFTFLLGLSFCFQVFPQNYAPLVEGRSYLFATVPIDKLRLSNAGIVGTRVDSSWMNGGKVHLLPERNPVFHDPYEDTCYIWDPDTWNTYPWLQQAYFKDSSQVYTFFNHKQEAIYINTTSKSGDTSLFYQYPGGPNILILHDSTRQDTVFEHQDSVKYFHLQTVDTAGNAIPNRYNGQILRLAKENGLIEGIRFEWFPLGVDSLHWNRTIDTSMILFQIGATRPDVGKYPLTDRHIDNYNVGDTIIIMEGHYDNYNFEETFEHRSVVIKRQGGNTMMYKIARRFWKHVVFYGDEYSKCWEDTLYLWVNLTTLPPLPNIPSQGRFASFHTLFNNSARGRELYLLQYDFLSANSCYSRRFITYSNYGIEGLGWYWDRTNSFRKPLYYKKGNEEWGTYIDFDTLSCTVGLEREKLTDIVVVWDEYSNQLLISQEMPQSLDFKLFSMDGKRVLFQPLPAEAAHSIHLGHVSKGIYSYLLLSKKGKWKSGKFVKAY